MSQHTPGPWRRGIGCDANRVFDNQGRIVAERTGYADGHLIAAAPDLLDAILQSDDAHWTPAMRAAINKATYNWAPANRVKREQTE